jgi:hypothetical protein
MRERTIRVLPDKRNNRFAIHDVISGDLLHIYYPTREPEISQMTPEQLQDAETDAIRDFMVNGDHDADDGSDEEPGW